MTDRFGKEGATSAATQKNPEAKWGARLFIATLIVVLAFFWWLLVHSGGVVVHHG